VTVASPTCRPIRGFENVDDLIPGLTPWAIDMPAHPGLIRWRYDVADHTNTCRIIKTDTRIVSLGLCYQLIPFPNLGSANFRTRKAFEN